MLSAEDEYNEDEREDVALKILVDRDGSLRETNQVVDYLFRDDTLSSMTFYDFCRCVRLEKMSTSRTKNTAANRLGVLMRHELKTGHPLSKTHRLIEHTNELRGEGSNSLVPRVMGMTFSVDEPLFKTGATIDSTFESTVFADKHQQILNNWEAIHECQDERDADRLRKRAEKSRESRAMTRALHGSIEASGETELDVDGTRKSKTRDVQGEVLLNLMRQCGWIQTGSQDGRHHENRDDSSENGFAYPEPTVFQLKQWANSVKEQENAATARRPLPLPALQVADKSIPVTEAPKRAVMVSSIADTVRSVAERFGLNEKQTMVYNIVARRFIDQDVLKIKEGGQPLRMLMTGQHLIRFLGPTGTSAKQIGGMTIHKGLGLSIALKPNGRGNRKG